MNEDNSNVSPEDIEELLAELKEEADEIGAVSYTHLRAHET